jgi:ABC-type lipoprotein release transport system permease subunit
MTLDTYLRFSLRNLWRNPQRTLLSLLSIVVATSVVVFLGALNDGWMQQMRENFILTYTGHVQIHAPGHLESGKLADYIRDPQPAMKLLEDDPAVAAWSPRLEAAGLASVAGASVGVRIIGVLPPRERHVSRLRRLVTTGRCFRPGEERRVVLGQDIARTLGVRSGDKLVLTSQTPDGEVRSDLFTLCGVIRSGAPQIDRQFALVPIDGAREWLDMEGGVTHIAVRVKDHRRVDEVAGRLEAGLDSGRFVVARWQDIDPMVSQWVRFSEAYGFIILAIVIALTIAQVSNTMVMSVHDRLPEFGLMEALGTRRRQLFAMVALEALVLVLLGGTLGWLAGAGLVALSAGGIDFSALAGAFEFFFMEPVIRPVLTQPMALKVVAALGLAAFLGGLYPAWRASRLDPVEAMK